MNRQTFFWILVIFGAFSYPLPCFAQFNKEDWRVEQVASDLTVGYAVHLCDLNGDGKTDFVVLDSRRVLAFLAPDFRPRELAKDFAKPDLVCVAALDVDRDGKLDLVIGADWKPFNTRSGGTIQWLRQPESLDQPWKSYPITEEPTIHRIRVADLDGDGFEEVVAVPLMGRDSSAKANWFDGRPVRILSLKPGKNPLVDPWKVETLNDTLHVVHNFLPVPSANKSNPFIVTASYEGLSRITLEKSGTKVELLHKGNQDKPGSNRGASEVARGRDFLANEMFATVEPWHGNQIVAYEEKPRGNWNRKVLDDQLKWGHAVSFADLDNDGVQEVIAGIRDNLADEANKRRGVRIYRRDKARPDSWSTFVLEDGGVAVEDLAVADLNGDGLRDIIVSGRATGNVRIYFQKPKTAPR